jgi:hypothetical protein
VVLLHQWHLDRQGLLLDLLHLWLRLGYQDYLLDLMDLWLLWHPNLLGYPVSQDHLEHLLVLLHLQDRQEYLPDQMHLLHLLPHLDLQYHP